MDNSAIRRVLFALLVLPCITGLAMADRIIVQSTTSTRNAGLYDYLLPIIKADTGVTAHVVAVGTWQAIKNAERCDGDVLLVHARASEQQFVANGFGVERFDLMYNDFVIIGPSHDPAGIHGMMDATGALAKIAHSKALFASRGDESGTHQAELHLWKGADIDPTQASGQWYRETGSGMGATLNTAVGMGAYVMSDRASWAKFGNKGDFKIHVEGDLTLFNQYGVILVSATKCPATNSKAGQQFVDWLLSERGQRAIASYQINGEQVFYPNAR